MIRVAPRYDAWRTSVSRSDATSICNLLHPLNDDEDCRRPFCSPYCDNPFFIFLCICTSRRLSAGACPRRLPSARSRAFHGPLKWARSEPAILSKIPTNFRTCLIPLHFQGISSLPDLAALCLHAWRHTCYKHSVFDLRLLHGPSTILLLHALHE